MTSRAAIAATLSILAGTAAAQCPSTETDKLTDPDGDNSFDRFGSAVALSGNFLVVGEEGQNRAHFFRQSNGVWARENVLGGAPANVEFLGTCIAIDQETGDERALVGAGVDSDYCPDPNDCATGAAVLYIRAQGVWSQVAKFQRPFYLDSFNQFGHTVDLLEDIAMIAASESGAGVVVPWEFDDVDDEWVRRDPLEASDGEEGDSFGRAIDLADGLCVVGAPGDDDSGPQSGSAYVFARNGSAWHEIAKLAPDDPQASSYFGSSVAFTGGAIAVGAPGPFGSGPGSVYIFDLVGGVWTQTAKLVPSAAAPGDAFGTRLAALGPNGLAASALRDGHAGPNAGAAYIYAKSNGAWTEQTKITASDATADQGFGISVSGYADRAAIGAYEAFNGGGGAVYFYEGLDSCDCPADFNADGAVNTLDVLAFLNAWSAGHDDADFNADGTVNTLDVIAFLNAWNAGC